MPVRPAAARTILLAAPRSFCAGASAPPRLVEAVITALAALGPVTVVERETTRETVRFTLPLTVRQS